MNSNERMVSRLPNIGEMAQIQNFFPNGTSDFEQCIIIVDFKQANSC